MDAPTTTQMSPRAQRFMRELHGFDAASTRRAMNADPDVRRWKRISAIVSIAIAACFVGLLAVIGMYAPPAAAQGSGPGAPPRVITAGEAWQMTRALGPRMVLIDIRGGWKQAGR